MAERRREGEVRAGLVLSTGRRVGERKRGVDREDAEGFDAELDDDSEGDDPGARPATGTGLETPIGPVGSVLRRILGVPALVIGVALLAWVLYNLFVEMQPQARGKNPVFAIGIAMTLIIVGSHWIRGKKAG
jgi:hypothetical protein